MDEYSALRDASFTAAELEELTDDMCEPRVVEVNPREPELRSGRSLRSAKHAKLPPRIEQHYATLAVHVMGLFSQHKAGVLSASADLVFKLRCLKRAESKCGSHLFAVLEELKFRGDGEVELVGSSSASVSVGKAKADVIEVEEYIIDCLIVGEKKPDPKKLDNLAAENVNMKIEPEVEAFTPSAVLVSAPVHKIQDEDENGPLWDIDPEFYALVENPVKFETGGRLDKINLGAVSVELKYPTPVEVNTFFSRFKGSSHLLSLNVVFKPSSPAIELNLADLPNLRRIGLFIDDDARGENTPWEDIESLSLQLLTALLEASLPRLAWVHLYGWQFISDTVGVLGDSLLPRLKKLDVDMSYFPYQSLDRLAIGDANSWARLKELFFVHCMVEMNTEHSQLYDFFLKMAQLLPIAARCPNLRVLGIQNEAVRGMNRGNDGPALITAIESGYWKDLEVIACNIYPDDGEEKFGDGRDVRESHVAEVAIKHAAWPKLSLLYNMENRWGKWKVLEQAFPNVELSSDWVLKYLPHVW